MNPKRPLDRVLGIPGIGYMAALGSICLASALIGLLANLVDLPDYSMLYLVPVLAIAIFFGRWPSIVASFAAFIAYNWFFIMPVGLGVANPAGWLSLLLLLVTGVVTSELAAGHRERMLMQVQEETKRRMAESQSLQQVSAALLWKLDLTEVLKIVCTSAQELTGASGSVVFLLEDHWLLAAGSAGAVLPKFARTPVEGSLTGQVVRSGEPAIMGDVGSEAEQQYWDVLPTSMLVIPLQVKGVVIGALDVVNKADGFTLDDQRIMVVLADQAALAIENARLYQQEHQLAVAEERQRIARELHDSVTQALYSLTLYAEAASVQLETGDTTTLGQHLSELQSVAQDALREMRVLIFELRPPALEKDGLVAALQARLEAVEGRARIEAELKVDGEPRLTHALEEQLYWIAVEGLNNALKHGHPRKVTVSLKFTDDDALLDVTDDGIGFEPEAIAKGGLGLSVMAERARQVGGTLELKTAPGRGTSIRVDVDLRAGAERPVVP